MKTRFTVCSVFTFVRGFFFYLLSGAIQINLFASYLKSSYSCYMKMTGYMEFCFQLELEVAMSWNTPAFHSALPSGDLQQGGNEMKKYFHIIVGEPGPLTYRWIFKSWPQVPGLIKCGKVFYLHEKSNILMIRKSQDKYFKIL